MGQGYAVGVQEHALQPLLRQRLVVREVAVFGVARDGEAKVGSVTFAGLSVLLRPNFLFGPKLFS